MSTEPSKLAYDINAEIKTLIYKLDSVLTAEGGATLTFISANADEGTTTIASAFALALQSEADKRVLLLTNDTYKSGIVEAYLSGKDLNSVLVPIGEGVSGGSWTTSDEGRRQFAKVSKDEKFWALLYDLFDVVVVDAPSLQTTPEGIGYAKVSDATIMVVAAESTRRHVVENLRDTLKTSGAKVVGIVMNRREFHIPKCVYKRL